MRKPQAQWTWNKKRHQPSHMVLRLCDRKCTLHCTLHTANSQSSYLTKWFASRGVLKAKDGATSVAVRPNFKATLP